MPAPAQNQDEDDGGWGGAPVPLSSSGKGDDGGWGSDASDKHGEWAGGPETTPKAQPARLKPEPSAHSQPQTGGWDVEPVQTEAQTSTDDNAGGWGAPEPKQTSDPSNGGGWGASEPEPVSNGNGGGWGQQGGQGNFGGKVSTLVTLKFHK